VLIYLAGGESAYLFNLLTEYNVRNILVSFYWLSKRDLDWYIRRIEEGRKRGVHFLLDSGAFTYQSRATRSKMVPLDKYVENYCEFIARYGHLFETCAEVDLAGHEIAGYGMVTMDDVLTWRTDLLHAAHDVDTSIMPVYHGETHTKDEWRELCGDLRYPYVGIGGLARERGDRQVALYSGMISYAHAMGKKVHGFAATKVQSSLKRLYWDSVDSGSWITAQTYGTVYIFRAGIWTQIEPYQKQYRRRYVPHFKRIGVDPKAILADDNKELIKASVIAWRDLSAWYEQKRARLNDKLSRGTQHILKVQRAQMKKHDTLSEPKRTQRKKKVALGPSLTISEGKIAPDPSRSEMDQKLGKMQLNSGVLAVERGRADARLLEAIRRRDERRAAMLEHTVNLNGIDAVQASSTGGTPNGRGEEDAGGEDWLAHTGNTDGGADSDSSSTAATPNGARMQVPSNTKGADQGMSFQYQQQYHYTTGGGQQQKPKGAGAGEEVSQGEGHRDDDDRQHHHDHHDHHDCQQPPPSTGTTGNGTSNFTGTKLKQQIPLPPKIQDNNTLHMGTEQRGQLSEDPNLQLAAYSDDNVLPAAASIKGSERDAGLAGVTAIGNPSSEDPRPSDKVVPFKTKQYIDNFAQESAKLLALPGLHCKVCSLESSCPEYVEDDTRPCHLRARFGAFPVRDPDNILGAQEFIVDKLKERLFKSFMIEDLLGGGVPDHRVTAQAESTLRTLNELRAMREEMEGEAVRTSSGRGMLSKLFGVDLGAAQVKHTTEINMLPAQHEVKVINPPVPVTPAPPPRAGRPKMKDKKPRTKQ
jgi:hypothetical protein